MFNNKIFDQMKRKIVNGLLLMAFVVSSVSTFVACKDYDEDVFVDVKSRISKEISLRQALQQQVDELEALVKSLKKCECDMTNYLTKTEANNTYLKISDYETYVAQITANKTAIALLQKAIDEINAKLAKVDVYTQKVDAITNQVNDMNALLLSVKATAEEALDLAKRGGCNCDLTDITKRVANLEVLVAGWDAQLKNVSNKAEAAYSLAQKDSLWIVKNKHTIDSLAEVIKNLPQGQGSTVDLTNILYRLQVLEATYITKEEVCKLCDQMKAQLHITDSIARLALQKAIDGYCSGNCGTTINYGDTTIINYGDTTIINYGDTTIVYGGTVNNYLDNKLAKADSIRIDSLETVTANLVSKGDFKKAIDAVNGRVDSLANEVAALDAEVDKLKNDIQNMINSIIVQGAQCPVIGYFAVPADLRSTMLAVYYGRPAANWEFPSGKSEQYVKSSDINMWTLRNKQVLGGSLSGIPGYLTGNAGQTLVTQKNGKEEGNAGTLYVTINPANVNYTGELKLKNSQDEDAPVTLTTPILSDRRLDFGFTRAAANGFYEAKATLKAADVNKAAMKIEYEALESNAKEIINKKNLGNVLEFGSALIKSIESPMPAYAAMGSWTDKSSGTVHNIYSQYSVATTAVKPFSFSFLQNFHVSKMPGLDRVQKLIGELVDKINVSVDLGLPDFAKYKGSIEFKTITLPTISDDLVHIEYHKKYTSDDLAGEGKLYGDTKDTDLYFLVTNVKDGRYALVSTSADGSTQKLWIADGSGAYHEATAAEQAAWGAIKFELSVDVDINKTPEVKQTLQDIIDSLNEQYGPNSDLAKNITNLLNDVSSLNNINGKIEQSITDVKNDIKNAISTYVTRGNDILVKWFNRAPGLIQLCLVTKYNDGKISMTPQALKAALKVKGDVTLVPSSYNLELLAPAYKKFIAVTDVFDAKTKDPIDIDEAKNLAAAANGENMGRVVDSDVVCTMNAGKAGHIYEVTYTAIDYFGKVAIKKYYIQF